MHRNVWDQKYLSPWVRIFGLHVYRKSHGSRKYYNASLPFTLQQVAYELYFVVLSL